MGCGGVRSPRSVKRQCDEDPQASLKNDEESCFLTIMTKSPQTWAWTSFEPNVMIIGYGHGNGVRRRGSVMPMINDAGSDDSALGNTCSGLRRKPIPIERFLRGGV